MRDPRVHPMSEQPATLEGTRRRVPARCATAALAAIACVSLTVLAIVAPSRAIVVALCACAVATGVVAAGGRLVLQVRPRRLAPIRPSARRALAEFRRELDALPETTHPIGR